MRVVIYLFCLGLFLSCNSQTVPDQNKSSVQVDESTSELIYFSKNNGESWHNKSKGLPSSSTIAAIAVDTLSVGLLLKETGVYILDVESETWKNIKTEKEIIGHNPTSLAFFGGVIYVGTQAGGVYVSSDMGQDWQSVNEGFENLSVRTFAVIENKIYAGTNEGLFSMKKNSKIWTKNIGDPAMQVNGITEFQGLILMGTSQGVFSSPIGKNEWKNVFPNAALHNISSDATTLYAMTYNELFSSVDQGDTWQSLQKGLPKDLYTFQVVKNGDFIFAGQWDGVYRRNNNDVMWQSQSQGLPNNLSITKMDRFQDMLIVGTSIRGLRKGMSIER